MSTADVFDVPARERITNVSSMQPYTLGWEPPRLTPEQVEANNRYYHAHRRQLLFSRRCA